MKGFAFTGLRCPACGHIGLETRDATDLEVYDASVIGWIDWSCPACDEEGYMSFEAVMSNATVYDDANRARYVMLNGKEVA